MNFNVQKTMAFAVVIFLILAMAISLVAVPASKAQVVAPDPLKVYPFVDATPNPVGVGQDMLIRLGILLQSGDASWGWTGLTVTVTKPDGTTENLGPFETDSTGGTFTRYVPSAVGTYKLRTNFPEQKIPFTFLSMESGYLYLANTTMTAVQSDELEVVVTTEPAPEYPGFPLPAEYWTRPVDPQLREWWPVTGNWLERPPNWLTIYNEDAPETAHVLWAKPLTTGGLAGGQYAGIPSSFETGDAYEGKFQNSIVLNGVLYYERMPQTFFGNIQPQQGIYAVDLRTGKELWFRNNTRLSFGQVFYFNSFNYDGTYDYIWDTASEFGKWNSYDPFTGTWLYSITNVPSGLRYRGPSGEILILVVNTNAGWMALWNMTACGQQNLSFVGDFGSWGRFVHGRTFDGSNPKCYSWNVTIPTGLTIGGGFFGAAAKVYSDRVAAVNWNLTQVDVFALSLTPSSRGQLLYHKVWQAPSEWLQGTHTIHYTGATNDLEGGVIAVWSKELRKHYGFSVETGNYLWQTDSEIWLNAYGFGNVEHSWWFAYGKLYSTGVGGTLYAYDLATGDTVWEYDMVDTYNEGVTGLNWWAWIAFITDGKVYMGHVEHSAEMPLPRGAPFVCLDAETGEVVWEVDGMFRQTRWGGCGVIADNIIATMDTYDQRIYAIGKGPTSTSALIRNDVLALGGNVLIQGMVTDISAGTKDDNIAPRFPNGVPAVADESMSDWMLHVYKQFPHPADVVGVPVHVHVLDDNGNYRNIGEATTDPTGFYSIAWKPDIPGKYQVIVSFAGTKSYWPSYAYTAFYVDEEAPGIPPYPTAEPVIFPPTDMYVLYATIAIIAAIVIIGLLILRKK